MLILLNLSWFVLHINMFCDLYLIGFRKNLRQHTGNYDAFKCVVGEIVKL